MKRESRDYIEDIVSAVDEIADFTKGMTWEEFRQDKKTINAVVRSLEVIGEASKRISQDIKTRYPDVPWKYMAGMRDKLIHEYFGIDLDIIWAVIRQEIPAVEPIIRQLLKEEKE